MAANEELEEAGKLKTAFIEVASHEFNTPITLVLGLTSCSALDIRTVATRRWDLVDRLPRVDVNWPGWSPTC